MNTLLWIAALVASTALAVEFFQNGQDRTDQLIAWMGVCLTLYSFGNVIDALLYDLHLTSHMDGEE